MKTLLGLFCLSTFLTAVFSLTCQICPLAQTCTPKNDSCAPNVDGCFTLQLENEEKELLTMKDCMPKKFCSELKTEVGKPITPNKYGTFPDGAIVRKVDCSKAPSSSASVLLALAGFLVTTLLL